MTTTIVNPYEGIGGEFTSGLDAVATALAPLYPTQIISDLVNADYTYMLAAYYGGVTDPFLFRELKSILPFSINAYVNSPYGGAFTQYNAGQQQIIYQMLEGLKTVPIESIYNYLENIENNIPKSGFGFREQSPLFLAVAIGKASYNYWLGKISTPGNWASFFNATASTNRTMLAEWVAAGIEGSLLGGGQASTYGLIDPPRITGIDLVTSLSSAIGIAAGKVIFKWIPEIEVGRNQYVKDVFQPINSFKKCNC